MAMRIDIRYMTRKRPSVTELPMNPCSSLSTLKMKSVWRSGKNRVLQRVISEARAGRHEVDVVHNPSPEMEALHREKLLKPVDSPLHKQLIPQAVPTARRSHSHTSFVSP